MEERLEKVQPNLPKMPGSGVSMCWGGRGGLGPPTKAFLLRTLWIPEDQVVLTMNASMKPHCLCPREAESSQD